MDRVKFITTQEAAALIPNDALIGTVGFMLTGAPEEVLLEMEERYIKEQEPKNLTLIWASGVGDGGRVRGINHLCHDGMLKRTIGGHYGLIPRLVEMVNQNKVEAYNYPQGVLTSLFRTMAAGRPGLVTEVGLGTFVDPDFQGGKLNSAAKEDLVIKIEIEGKEYLFYKAQKINVAIIRGTEADTNGNISFEKEALKVEALSVATAARNNGGIIIAQVQKVVKEGTIKAKDVVVPGALVDYVATVSDEKNHMQTAGTQYNEDFITSRAFVKAAKIGKSALDSKKVVSRRAAMEVDANSLILNYGIGLPEGVAEVLKEEGLQDRFIATVEPGVYGGTAQGKLNFGSALFPQAIIDHPYQFDFYDGGGIDVTFLGMAECNSDGSLNVSKFGPKIAGCGGFIDISQNAKKCVFCGAFTAGGLEVEVVDGKINILKEGRVKKFVNDLEHITFNGKYESQKNKRIILVTERAVFSVEKEGLTLIEIAPGIDLEKDILNLMEFEPIIAKDLKIMDERLFKTELMGLTL